MSRLAHPHRPHQVPKYPGPPPRKPPEPPKFLLTTEEAEGGSQKQQIIRVRGAPSRPKGVSDEPVLSTYAKTTTIRDIDSHTPSPANHYPKRVPYQLPTAADKKTLPPNARRGKGRDSSRDVKQVHRSSIVVEEPNPNFGTPYPPPSHVPKLPAIPTPFVPKPRAAYSHLPQMHQRSADGKIFGGATRRYVPAEYVPYQDPAATVAAAGTQEEGQGEQYDQYGYDEQQLQPYEYEQDGEYTSYDEQQLQVAVDVPVGPENPMKQLSDTWSACWDDEAGAVYYYNHTSGEATWVRPDDLG